MAKLAKAIAVGGELSALVSFRTSHQQRRDELAAVKPVSRKIDRKAVATKVRERL